MKRTTVGSLSTQLLNEKPDTRNPIELQRAMHSEYISEIYTCIERGIKDFPGDFYCVVITKKEPLMENVMRNYFFPRSTCPTPDYDQTVYKYHRDADEIEFLWVVPSKDACLYLKDNALLVDKSEHWLLNCVLSFADGSLYTLCKQLNKELP